MFLGKAGPNFQIIQIAKLGEGEGGECRNYGRTGRGGFRAEDSEFSEEEGRAELGSGEGWKLGVGLVHGCDYKASGEKAVSLEVLDGLRCLKSLVLLRKKLHWPQKGT
jgi:hypothetical protein